jgi:hypothetical protein
MKIVLALAALALQAQPDPQCEMEKQVPADVRPYLARAANCNHWTGEEPYDAKRRREIERNIRDLGCAALERDGQRLRDKYATAPQILTVMVVAEESLGWPLCPRPKR